MAVATPKVKKNYRTHNDDKSVNCYGSLMGYIDVTYAELKKAFGNPHKSDEYKSDAEWEIEFDNGVKANIYNYKDGKNYLGSKGTPKTKITHWHVGGLDERAVEMVKQVFNIQ